MKNLSRFKFDESRSVDDILVPRGHDPFGQHQESNWDRPEVLNLGADQKDRGLWGREWIDESAWEFRPNNDTQKNPQKVFIWRHKLQFEWQIIFCFFVVNAKKTWLFTYLCLCIVCYWSLSCKFIFTLPGIIRYQQVGWRGKLSAVVSIIVISPQLVVDYFPQATL